MYIGEVVDFPTIEPFKLLISWHITTQLVVGRKCAYDQAKADWSKQVQKLPDDFILSSAAANQVERDSSTTVES
jgi:hypothetical protein